MRVLITGATRGIGRALRDLYRAEVTGTRRDGTASSGTGRDSTGGDSRGGDGWETLEVTDPASHAALGARWAERPLDLLVCNAGVYLDRGQRLDDGFAAPLWAESFAVNVTGVFLAVQALLPSLRLAAREAGVARIAVISSQMGSDQRAPGGSYIYRASKAAALNLGRNLATDLRGEAIAVGIYHPGWVRTEMGGSGAEIAPEAAAAGLKARFAALDLGSTGRFETWDGREHPF